MVLGDTVTNRLASFLKLFRQFSSMSSAVSTHFCRPMACVLLQPIQKRDVSSKKTKHWLKCRVRICDYVNSVPAAADCIFSQKLCRSKRYKVIPTFTVNGCTVPFFLCLCGYGCAVQDAHLLPASVRLWPFSCSLPQSSVFLRGTCSCSLVLIPSQNHIRSIL